MKLTEDRLRKIIREEAEKLNEVSRNDWKTIANIFRTEDEKGNIQDIGLKKDSEGFLHEFSVKGTIFQVKPLRN